MTEPLPVVGGVGMALRALIRAYQLVVSPALGHHCRHLPSCSEYTAEAVAVHGPTRGSWLGFKRVLRCNPWGSHGYDPVPPRTLPASHPRQR